MKLFAVSIICVQSSITTIGHLAWYCKAINFEEAMKLGEGFSKNYVDDNGCEWNNGQISVTAVEIILD